MLLLRFISAYSHSRRSRSPLGRPWRLVFLASAFVLILSGIVLAQDDGSSVAGSSADQKFTVSGTVVNEASGEPIPRAMVTLIGSPMRYAFSDSSGSFTIEGVPAGHHIIHAQKPGYFGPQERGGPRSVQSVEVGTNNDAIVIKLAAENVIYGRLTESNGQPIESVGLRLMQRALRNGSWRMESRSSANTDDDGAYRLRQFASRYLLRFGRPRCIASREVVQRPERAAHRMAGHVLPAGSGHRVGCSHTSHIRPEGTGRHGDESRAAVHSLGHNRRRIA